MFICLKILCREKRGDSHHGNIRVCSSHLYVSLTSLDTAILILSSLICNQPTQTFVNSAHGSHLILVYLD